ncbi:hypothetical protein C7S18_01205 [Ahniella affigens]|uniref:Uncharacterized protein n=1 Tax=Ahniella affigens TaxID=2021234 RepID=A0A2P1PM28_9GAMM|nr:hypothetical protein [Ahniella affigens]AVP95898.1 hypothetical protein C7S18_01205 [Ahniella affigens]
MTAVPPLPTLDADQIERAMQVLERDDLNPQQEEAALLAVTGDPMLARRVQQWLPEVLAMVFMGHTSDEVVPPEQFHARNKAGVWQVFELRAEPLVPDCFIFAARMIHAGARPGMVGVLQRSALFKAFAEVSDGGAKSVRGANFRIALRRIPAEIYIGQADDHISLRAAVGSGAPDALPHPAAHSGLIARFRNWFSGRAGRV